MDDGVWLNQRHLAIEVYDIATIVRVQPFARTDFAVGSNREPNLGSGQSQLCPRRRRQRRRKKKWQNIRALA